MAIQLACSTICFRHWPIEVALDEIRQAGFTTVDLAVIPGYCPHFDAVQCSDYERKVFTELVKRSGLRVPVVTAAPGHFNAAGADREAILEAAEAHLRLAVELGAQILSVHCGQPIADRSQFREHAAAQARGLKRMAQRAAAVGVRLAIEAPHGNGLARTLDEAEFLLSGIGERNAWYLVDAAHVRAGGARPEEAVRRFGERVLHVHLRDGKKDGAHAPDDGPSAFRPFLAALDRIGYGGHCALELEDDAGETLDERRAAVRRALEHFRAPQAGAIEGVRPFEPSIERGAQPAETQMR